MTFFIGLRGTRWLAAIGFAFSVFAVGAASGGAVGKAQQAAVVLGMTFAEVQAILGRPANTSRYRSAKGPTWTYREDRAVNTEFDVNFGPDGKVESTHVYVRVNGN